MRLTTAYKKIDAMSGRVRVAQGGSRAGKTFAILQKLISIAEQIKVRITVTSDTFPSLRLGAMADFETILAETGHHIYFIENKTFSTWTCTATGSVIEFWGLDQPLKAHGPARDILFVNEANRVKYKVYEQLAMRTSMYIFLDYNPSAKFWVHKEIQGKGDNSFEILTYRDNEECPPEIVKHIESHDRDSNWWKVYGLGQIGELEGNVLKGWELLDILPESKQLLGYGLDFGFRPDPCALVSLWREDDFLDAQEEWILPELTSKQIIEKVKEIVPKETLVVCDNARPEIIRDMQLAGIQAIPCIKQEKIAGITMGKLAQLEKMNEYQFKAVGETLHAEYLDYRYIESKSGDFVSKVPDGDDHCLDALRYVWYWFHRKDILDQVMANTLKEY